jgi:signal transduction histidine kinase
LIKFNIYIAAITGILLGLVLPIFLVFTDLQELSMEHNIKNFLWVMNSQNAILFSFIGLPIVSCAITILISLFLKRNHQLLIAQQAVTKMAHAAGMAEIASEVIHNIGNILTGIFIHTDSIKMTIEDSKYLSISKAKTKLNSKREQLKEFYDQDPELEKLMDYFIIYGENTVKEYSEVIQSVDDLKAAIYTIRDILIAQQSVAASGAFIEEVSVEALIDNAIHLLNDKLTKHEVDVSINIEENTIIHIEKSKVVNILCNLIKNAYEAMEDLEKSKIDIKLKVNSKTCSIIIKDYGVGMSKEQLKNIFTYGFTTKEKGSGFGLHSCLNLANSIDGELKAESQGSGKGSSFILTLPYNKKLQEQTVSNEINFS